MNCPGTVRRQMGQPVLSHHPGQNLSGPVAKQVRTVDQQHRRTTLSSGVDLSGTLLNRGPQWCRARLGGQIGIQ